MVKSTVLIDRREQVFKRLRTNEALEEDLDIANKRIIELEHKLALVMAAVADAQSRFEDSEQPFYTGMKTLQGILK